MQEQDIRSDLRAGGTLEGIVGQTNGSQKVSSLGDILADGGVLLVHCSLGGDESDDTAGTNLIQGAGKKVIVDQEIVFVIPLVGYLELAEGDIADGSIEEAVGQIGLFIALNGDAGFLVELLGDTA